MFHSGGTRVVDFGVSNLHVVQYSSPINAVMPLSELRPHLHTLPDHPDRNLNGEPQLGRRGLYAFINSTQGLRATAGIGPYAATKHAMKALADSLRD